MENEAGKPKRIRAKLQVMDAALKYLSYRMRSEYEMRRYLLGKDYTQIEIDDTIAKLIEYRYIDDMQFAKELIRQKTATRPTGKRKLKQHLMQSGIDVDVMESGLDGYSEQQEQQACDELYQKLIARHGTDAKALQRIQRQLLSRGFGYEQIRASKNALSHELEVMD